MQNQFGKTGRAGKAGVMMIVRGWTRCPQIAIVVVIITRALTAIADQAKSMHVEEVKFVNLMEVADLCQTIKWNRDWTSQRIGY